MHNSLNASLALFGGMHEVIEQKYELLKRNRTAGQVVSENSPEHGGVAVRMTAQSEFSEQIPEDLAAIHSVHVDQGNLTLSAAGLTPQQLHQQTFSCPFLSQKHSTTLAFFDDVIKPSQRLIVHWAFIVPVLREKILKGVELEIPVFFDHDPFQEGFTYLSRISR
jgi:hypothetical protein